MTSEHKIDYKVINKHIMLERRNCGSWYVMPNIFEATKAAVVFQAKDSSKQYLPYFPCSYFQENDYPDLMNWRDAFTSDNPPEKISFRGRDSELSEAIKDIDFSKPFDSALADSIRKNFAKNNTRKSDVDADLLLQGELGELPEQKGI